MLTVKNRYIQEPFIGVFDGQTYEIKSEVTLPNYIAYHLKKQSIIRDNPITGDNSYRLAIVEEGDDVTPLTELPQESLDRTDMDWQKVKIIPSNIRAGMPERKGSGRFDSMTLTKER